MAFAAQTDIARVPSSLPPIVWVVFGSTAAAVITTGITVFGIPVNALAWLIPLCVGLYDLVVVPGRVRFPIGLWLPWVLLILGYASFADTDHAFQRSVMILAPLVVGMAVSKREVGEGRVLAFKRACRILVAGLIVGAALKMGLSLGEALPDTSPLAPEAMTGSLLCTMFAASYALDRKSDLVWWAVLAMVPVVGVTRTGIVATAVTLPLTLAPLGTKRRIGLATLIAVAGLAVFHSDRVQKKMFVSGHGSVFDLTLDNPDVSTSGRRRVWEYLEAGTRDRPWFGHGANACEPIVFSMTAGATHPHNDWLRIRYEYGWLGAGLFALTMLAQGFHLWRTGQGTASSRRLLALAGASSFISFALFMATDNIILYASYFGHLQFTIIGMAYAADVS